MSSSGDIPIEILAGFIVLMLGIVSFSIQMAIRRSRKLNSPAQEQEQREKTTDTQREKNALAEALRRNPELANGDDPEILRQLKAETSDIIEEMRTAELLSKVNQEKAAAQKDQLLQEQRLANEQKAKEQAQQVAEYKRLAQVALIEKTANYSFIKRTIARHKIETAIGAGLVLAIILTLTFTVGIPQIQRQQVEAAAQQEAQQKAQQKAQEEAQQAQQAAELRSQTITDCNTRSEMGDLNALDDKTLFLYCGTTEFRLASMDIIRDSNVLNVLATDPDARVREKVASNVGTSPDTLNLLVSDQEASVRLAVAGQKNATPKILAQLANDQKFTIRLKVAQNMGTSLMTLRALANDENKTVAGVAQESLNK